jgi:simple sugar transport system permease protein
MGIVGICLSGLSVRFVLNELIARFIRDGVLVLSLVIPVVAGMGLN